MCLTLTYEFKIEPSIQQADTMNQWLEACRKVWNLALSERKGWYNSGSWHIDACSLKTEYIIPADAPKPTFASQCKALTEERAKNPLLKAVHSQVLQQVLRQLEKAFVRMREQKYGFPRFKKEGRMRSFLFPQLGKDPLRGNCINLPSIGSVKMRVSRPVPDGFILKQVRVLRRASGWYAMLALQADVDLPQPIPHGNAVGISLGLEKFLATSFGEAIAQPRFFVNTQRKLKLLQKRVSHKVLDSNNWRKAQKKVSRLHEYISNCRKDFHFKLAHHLCDQAGMVFAEDLNINKLAKEMLPHALNTGWGQFLSILEWVCRKRGVFFFKVNPNGTSQTCPNCLTATGEKELSERVHKCPECGYETDQEVAAAQVVVQRGFAAVGHTVKMLSEGKVFGLPLMKEFHT